MCESCEAKEVEEITCEMLIETCKGGVVFWHFWPGFNSYHSCTRRRVQYRDCCGCDSDSCKGSEVFARATVKTPMSEWLKIWLRIIKIWLRFSKPLLFEYISILIINFFDCIPEKSKGRQWERKRPRSQYFGVACNAPMNELVGTAPPLLEWRPWTLYC